MEELDLEPAEKALARGVVGRVAPARVAGQPEFGDIGGHDLAGSAGGEVVEVASAWLPTGNAGETKKGHRIEPMTLMFLVAGEGFEPTTSGFSNFFECTEETRTKL